MHTANESHETAGTAAGASTTRCASRSASSAASRRGTCRSICSPGRSRPRSRPACTVVAKPSEVTPMTAYLLSKLCIEAGLAAGRAQHRPRHRARRSARRSSRTRTSKRSRSPAARKPARRSPAPPRRCSRSSRSSSAARTRTSSSPTAITSEMLATRPCARRSANQGEICLCGSRIFVERPIYERFKEDFVADVSRAEGRRSAGRRTPMSARSSRKQHFDKIMSYIDLAQEEGGTILTGGKVEPVRSSTDAAPTAGSSSRP